MSARDPFGPTEQEEAEQEADTDFTGGGSVSGTPPTGNRDDEQEP